LIALPYAWLLIRINPAELLHLGTSRFSAAISKQIQGSRTDSLRCSNGAFTEILLRRTCKRQLVAWPEAQA
jgi:hypothetical protein